MQLAGPCPQQESTYTRTHTHSPNTQRRGCKYSEPEDAHRREYTSPSYKQYDVSLLSGDKTSFQHICI